MERPIASSPGAGSKSIKHGFVDVTPFPGFAGFDRAHDRVLSGMKMLGRVFVFRRIATAHVPTFQTHAQVHPSVAHLQAFLAPLRTGFHVFDLIHMAAGLCHEASVESAEH
jgi:hypothetical protein